MTKIEMLARARTLLDESSASFWTDVEIYAALTDGQQEVTNYFLNLFIRMRERNKIVDLPLSLRPLLVSADDSILTGDTDSLPATFMFDVDVSYGVTAITKKPAFKREYSVSSHLKANTYTSATDYYYSIDSTNIVFEYLPNGDHYYTLVYLRTPTAISAAVEPILPVQTHSAIVHWAVSQMLLKDQRAQESQLYTQNFLNELKMIG